MRSAAREAPGPRILSRRRASCAWLGLELGLELGLRLGLGLGLWLGLGLGGPLRLPGRSGAAGLRLVRA